MKNLENGMVLYHGSYCVVENPDLEKCAAFKDFGRGFYLTSVFSVGISCCRSMGRRQFFDMRTSPQLR